MKLHSTQETNYKPINSFFSRKSYMQNFGTLWRDFPSFSKTLKNADFIAERRSLEKIKEVKEATDITSVLHRRLIFYLFSIIKQNFVL